MILLAKTASSFFKYFILVSFVLKVFETITSWAKKGAILINILEISFISTLCT